MKAKSWLHFFVGLMLGVILSGLGFFVAQVGSGFASWGALQYETDAKVRSMIQRAGIVLPKEVYDIHYGVAGFVDSSEWIRFTVPKEKIWDVVSGSIGKSEADFISAHPEHLLKEIPLNPDQSHDTAWWNPSSVTSPKSWSNPSEKDGQHFFEDWLIDMETGTFYITRWDT